MEFKENSEKECCSKIFTIQLYSPAVLVAESMNKI